eukprot:6981265-Prorocentrum_lima.AAC.1
MQAEEEASAMRNQAELLQQLQQRVAYTKVAASNKPWILTSSRGQNHHAREAIDRTAGRLKLRTCS